MLNFIKQHKIATIITFNLVVVVIVVIAIIIHFAKTAVVDILVAPKDAVVTLNGRRYDNQKQHDVLPGNYHVKITMDGMQTKEYDITLERTGFVKIWDYLLDVNGSFDYYNTHPEDETILAEVVEDNDEAAKAFIAQYDKITSIFDQLPIIDQTSSANGNMFGVKYMYDTLILENGADMEQCQNPFCIYAKDTLGGREDYTKNLILELGFDPSDYQIIYEKVEREE